MPGPRPQAIVHLAPREVVTVPREGVTVHRAETIVGPGGVIVLREAETVLVAPGVVVSAPLVGDVPHVETIVDRTALTGVRVGTTAGHGETTAGRGETTAGRTALTVDRVRTIAARTAGRTVDRVGTIAARTAGLTNGRKSRRTGASSRFRSVRSVRRGPCPNSPRRWPRRGAGPMVGGFLQKRSR